jgi:predicted small integral membrane protein
MAFMIEARLAKLAMVGSIALFALVVAYDNIVDYGSNYTFVQHVLSMDDTFPGNALRDRAITSPVLWSLAYWLIILAEALTGAAFAVGFAAMARALRADAGAFGRAKRFVFIGAGMGFLLWFLAFMVVGGEWFAMWQSKVWNGQQAAFRFYLTLLAVVIFVNQPDADLPRPRPLA